MRFFGVVLLSLISCALTAEVPQSSNVTLTSCGLGCLSQAIPLSNCSSTDVACQCNSTILPTLAAECAQSNCTMHDSLVLAKVMASTCGFPNETDVKFPTLLVTVLFGVTTFFVILRLFSKCWTNNAIGVDDWIISCALLFSIPGTCLFLSMVQKGFGKHVSDLNDGDLLDLLRHFYIAENFYIWALALAKIAVLVFYLRVFLNQRGFRCAVFATIGLITTSSSALSLMTILACRPVAFFWNKDIAGGTCININTLAHATSAISIAQDVLVVIIPIPVVVRLYSYMKKLGAIVMFIVGAGGCAAAVFRLLTLLSFDNSVDQSYDFVNVIIWTAVELAIFIVYACLPAICGLVVHLLPKRFSKRFSSSNPQDSSRISKNWSSFGSEDSGTRSNSRLDNLVELSNYSTQETNDYYR